MSDTLRVLLLLGAVAAGFYIFHSVRHSRVQMKDTIIWLAVAALLMIFGFFPDFVMWMATLAGIESPANMVFLILIGILMIRNFKLSVRVSMLEDKNITMAAEIAIHTKASDEKIKEMEALMKGNER